MKKILIIVVVVVLACAVIFLLQSKKERFHIIRINVFNDPTDYPILVGEMNNYFYEEGIIIEKKPVKLGSEAMASLYKGELDIASVGSFVFVNELGSRESLKLFATYLYTYTGYNLMVLKDSGINKPEDLKGKVLGVVKGAQQEFFLYYLLTYYNILPEEVTYVNMDYQYESQVNAIKNKAVDAFISVPPVSGQILNDFKDELFILPTDRVYRANMNYIADSIFIDENTEVLKRFLKAVNKAMVFIRGAEDKDILEISEYTGVDVKSLKYIFSIASFGLILDQEILITMESQLRWKKLQNPSDLNIVDDISVYIETELLRSIAPEAVTIITDLY